jgi:hypothetical protein
MIPHPTGWTRENDGDAMMLFYRGDRSHGFLRYVERLPFASALDLLSMQLANDPQFEVDSITAPEEVVTREGEHAAIASVYGRLEGLALRRDFGWIFGDAHVARISGMTTRPELRDTFAETLRELVLADEQHLGIRRRACRHVAPAGWAASTRGFATAIYEARGAQIEVSAAMPYHGCRELVEQQIEEIGDRDGLVIEHRSDARRVVAQRGLDGHVWELTCRQGGTRFRRDVVTLVDDRYLYSLRLDALDDTGRDAFDAVVRSVEPIPRASQRRTSKSVAAIVAAFGHWC